MKTEDKKEKTATPKSEREGREVWGEGGEAQLNQ